MTEEVLAKTYAFLDRIGIPYRETSLGDDMFLPGLCIADGTVLIDRAKLKYPGDVLHEAGHIALTPPDLRPSVSNESLAAQPANESEEVGVILWTYLAAKETGIPVEVVFHADGYKDGSAWIVETFREGKYLGLPLLVWMGVADADPEGGVPRVKSWLRI